MAGPKSTLTFSSLQKYTRKRQLFAKNGFYLAINSTGEVTGTSDESSLYGKDNLLLVYKSCSKSIALRCSLFYVKNISSEYELTHAICAILY